MQEGEPTIQPAQINPRDIIEEPEQNEIPERREQLDPEVVSYWEEQIRQLQEEVEYWRGQALEALKDDLTGLPNFKSFQKRIGKEIEDVANSEKKTESLGVIFIDMNGFKEINDTIGHEAADEILKKVAEIINSKIRPETDWAARRSGDEFLIVIGGVKQTKIEQAFKSLKDRINSALVKPINVGDRKVPVSLSMGLAAVLKNGEPKDWKQLTDEADMSMREDKAAYRNGLSQI